MERPIKQNFAPLWRLMRLALIPPGIAAVAAAIAFYSHGQRDPMKLLFDALEFFIVWIPLLVVIALSRMQPTVKWFIADIGLMRVIRRKVLVIPWARIYHMADTKSGFFVRWRDLRERGVGAGDLDHRALLYPAKADAEELLELWRRNTSGELQAAGKVHFKARNRRDAKNLSVVGKTMIVGGAMLIAWRVLVIARQYPSTYWPSVEGKILFQVYNATPTSRGYPFVVVSVSYEYAVAGETNRSTQYSLAHATVRGYEPSVAPFAQSHQKGAIVPVYYNPKHPQEAVLQTGPTWQDDGPIMMLGGVFAFVGVLSLVIVGMGKRAQQTPVH